MYVFKVLLIRHNIKFARYCIFPEKCIRTYNGKKSINETECNLLEETREETREETKEETREVMKLTIQMTEVAKEITYLINQF